MNIILLLTYAVYMTNGSYLDDIDEEIILSADANICCKAQTTEWGCLNGATREKQRNSCIWLDVKNDEVEKRMYQRWNSRCLTYKFYDCKYHDFYADCTGDEGNACQGSTDPTCTNRTIVCAPTYDVVTLNDISVSNDHQIGEVNIFNNYVNIYMTFTTPKSNNPLQAKVNTFFQIGSGIIKFSLTSKNRMCVVVNGVSGCLGTKFIWEYNTKYKITFTSKKHAYARIKIGKYKQKSKRGTPDMGFMNGFTELLPIYAGMGANVAVGAIINSVEIKTWMYDPKDWSDELDDLDDLDEYMVFDDDLYYDYEENESIFSVMGLFAGEDTANDSLMDYKIFGGLAVVIVLCGGYYYFYKRDKSDKYIEITDGANRI